jgi:hypothetical protein
MFVQSFFKNFSAEFYFQKILCRVKKYAKFFKKIVHFLYFFLKLFCVQIF